MVVTGIAPFSALPLCLMRRVDNRDSAVVKEAIQRTRKALASSVVARAGSGADSVAKCRARIATQNMNGPCSVWMAMSSNRLAVLSAQACRRRKMSRRAIQPASMATENTMAGAN